MSNKSNASYYSCVSCSNSVSSSLLPLPRPYSPYVTSCTIAIVAHPASCPLLPHRGCSYCPYKRPTNTSGCDWVSPPLPLLLLSSGAFSLPFFWTCTAPYALAFLVASLRFLLHEGVDIMRKLTPSVSSPQIQTSH